MGVRSGKIILAALTLTMVVSECSQKEMSGSELCDEFYRLNKDRKWEELFDVSIGSGRITNVYDRSKNKYDLVFNTIAVFDTASKEYFILPVFKKNASDIQKDSAFNQITAESKNLLSRKLGTVPEKLFVSYVHYINAIYDKYYSIETPDSYGSKNVVLQGNPSLGKFIKFTLNDAVSVYYVADASTLNQYWLERFNTLRKLSESEDWFCEISESKTN